MGYGGIPKFVILWYCRALDKSEYLVIIREMFLFANPFPKLQQGYMALTEGENCQSPSYNDLLLSA